MPTPIRMTLDHGELRHVRRFANNCAIGGTSRIRAGDDRQQHLMNDQATGQLGEMALSQYLTGSSYGYQLSRDRKDRDPYAGDGGSDLLGTNVDVKTSVMRKSLDPAHYRLLVRPAERHAGLVYVLALVAPDCWDTGVVDLIGWYPESELPAAPATAGAWAGAFVVPSPALYRLPPLSVSSFYDDQLCQLLGLSPNIWTP